MELSKINFKGYYGMTLSIVLKNAFIIAELLVVLDFLFIFERELNDYCRLIAFSFIYRYNF